MPEALKTSHKCTKSSKNFLKFLQTSRHNLEMTDLETFRSPQSSTIFSAKNYLLNITGKPPKLPEGVEKVLNFP